MHETIAYDIEPSFGEAPGTADLRTFGGDTQVSELSLDNAAERIRTPGDADPWRTVFQNFEGSITVQGTLTSGNLAWLPMVFGTSSSPYAFQKGLATTGRVYVGADPSAGTIERELMGVVVTGCDVSFSDGENVTFELTCAYADEQKNAALTQATPIQPSGDPFITHSATISIAGTSMTKTMQESTLSLNSQARMQTGFPRHGIDAVMGGHESQIEVSKILKADEAFSDVGYGSTDASAPVDNPDGSAAVIEATAPAGSVTFDLGDVYAGNYDWSNAGNVNEDLLEGATLQVNHPEVAVAAGGGGG